MSYKFNPFTGTFDDSTVGTVSTGTAAAPGIAFESDPNTGIYSPGADQVAISTNGTGRLFVDASGRLGIGTASPAVPLDVNGNMQTSPGSGGGLVLHESDNTRRNRIQLTADSDGAVINSTFSTAGSTSILFKGGGTERMRLDSTGRLGLGTSSPDTLLHISSATGTASPTPTEARISTISNGSDWSTANPWGRLSFYCADASGSGPRVHAAIDTIAGVASGVASNLDFKLDNSSGSLVSRLYISYDGRVGIGTTSPSNTLTVAGSGKFGPSGDTNGYLILDGVTNSYFSLTATNGYVGADSNLILCTNSTGTERARIDSSGRLLVGASAARTVAAYGIPGFQNESTSIENASASLIANTNTNASPALIIAKTRGTSVGSFTAVSSGDALGVLQFQGADGTQLVTGARISVEVDGTPGANDMPGRLVFSTTADGASSPTERVRITSDAYVRLASGTGGIQFNGDTAAANALDDYEEGTWTPTATPSTSGTITLGSITASYTKVGNTVSIRADATVSAVSSPLGYIDISLPFTNSGNATGSVFFYNGATGAEMSNFIGRVSGNVFRITYGTGQVGAPSAPYARANTEITITAVYRN